MIFRFRATVKAWKLRRNTASTMIVHVHAGIYSEAHDLVDDVMLHERNGASSWIIDQLVVDEPDRERYMLWHVCNDIEAGK